MTAEAVSARLPVVELPAPEPVPSVPRDPFPGTSVVARLMRELDWSSTALGEPVIWSRSLLTTLDICLESRFPIVLFWGSQLTVLYNDDYLPMVGQKHPWALGRPGREVWSEIWEVVGPMLDQVMTTAVPTWSDDLLLYIARKGFPEQSYFTFTYSPVRGEDGTVEGIFCAVYETTARVRSERRLRLLRELSADPRRDARDAAGAAVRRLSGATDDVTFAAIVLHPEDPSASPDDSVVIGPRLGASTREQLGRVARQVAASGRPERFDLGRRRRTSAIALPMLDAGAGNCDVLVLGRHPAIPDDDDYAQFFGLVATHVATELASARAHEAERRRADALAELDRAKTVFFTNVSHEFRTPLTLLESPLHEVLDDPGLASEHRERIELARRASNRLRRLVNTLLEFSRIESGTARPELRSVDLGGVLDDVASVFRSAFERAGLTLEVIAPRRPTAVWADPEMLERILLNLISNAFKFTEHGGVRIVASEVEAGAVVEVSDTGIGIASHELARVFDRFARLDATWSRSREGSGIGLALAAELALIQGGRLEVQSAPGDGSTFRLTLPLARADAVTRPSGSQDRSAFADEVAGWVHATDDSTAEAVTDGAAQGIGTSAGDRILVVDDNADMNAYLRRILGRHWRVERESNGLRALRRILRDPPDLVLADVMMPGIDGLELVRRVRGEPRLATLPIVLLSARAGDEARAEGLAAGANEYLLKPFRASDLVVRIASHLERDRARRAESAALTRRQEELHDLVARLRRNERELETALQVKDEFLGMVSHELRTPVTTIRGNAELLLSRSGTLDPEVMRGALQDIAADGERLNRVIENLLLLARVGNDRLETEPVNVRRLVQRVAEAAERENPDRRVAVRCATGLLTIANDGAVEQILKNLVSNALKYSEPPAPVRIDVVSKDGWLAISVVDRGLGLPEADRERIFEPFYRSAHTEKIAGVGIGLTVARRLAEAVGGSLRADPRHRGARFTLRLPALQPEEDEPQARGTGTDGPLRGRRDQ